jgi:hypothetical protein
MRVLAGAITVGAVSTLFLFSFSCTCFSVVVAPFSPFFHSDLLRLDDDDEGMRVSLRTIPGAGLVDRYSKPPRNYNSH